MKIRPCLTKQLWLSLILSLVVIISGCNGELTEVETSPPTGEPLVTPPPVVNPSPTEELVGTWENKDEDGDGVLDENDDYPFDAEKSSYPITRESSFNDNPAVATDVDDSIPFKLSGVIEEQGDGDVYKFQVSEELVENEIPVSFLLLMDKAKYKPTVSILDDSGSVIFEIKNNTLPVGRIGSIFTTIFDKSGVYYVAIAEIYLEGSSEYSYVLKAFQDADFDALSEGSESALGIRSDTSDSDGDRISDGNEFYVHRLGSQTSDVDSDNTPNWLDTDSDGDGLHDSIELINDVDRDGIPAFADLDSDGNLIIDSEEAVDLAYPIDSGRNNIPDFIDLDDDSDYLFDIFDDERLTPLSVDSEIKLHVARYLDDTGVEFVDKAFSGKRIYIQGENIPLINSKFVLFNESSTYNLDVFNASSGGFYINLPENLEGEEEFEYFITNGDKRSLSEYIKIMSEYTPIISNELDGVYQVGDKVILNGVGLTSNINVYFGDIKTTPVQVENNIATVNIPDGAVSGFVFIEKNNLKSNKIYINIGRAVSISMDESLFPKKI